MGQNPIKSLNNEENFLIGQASEMLLNGKPTGDSTQNFCTIGKVYGNYEVISKIGEGRCSCRLVLLLSDDEKAFLINSFLKTSITVCFDYKYSYHDGFKLLLSWRLTYNVLFPFRSLWPR